MTEIGPLAVLIERLQRLPGIGAKGAQRLAFYFLRQPRDDVDALLGSESLRNSLIAGLVGLGLVMAFMIAYYRMAGVVASVSLIFYSILVLQVKLKELVVALS